MKKVSGGKNSVNVVQGYFVNYIDAAGRKTGLMYKNMRGQLSLALQL